MRLRCARRCLRRAAKFAIVRRHVELRRLSAGRGRAPRRAPRAGDEAAPSRRRSSHLARVQRVEARGTDHRDRCAGLRRHGADARKPPGDRARPHDRPRVEVGLRAQWTGERALLRALKSPGYDLLVHLTDHPRGLTLARTLAPRYAVTRERRDGERAWLWKRYFTHFYKLPRATPRHTVETNLDALRRIGVEPTADDKALVLVPSAAAQARAQALLREHGLAPRGFVHVHPGSRWLFKCWTAAQSAELLDRLAADGHALVVTGAPDPRERALVDAILGGVGAATR